MPTVTEICLNRMPFLTPRDIRLNYMPMLGWFLLPHITAADSEIIQEEGTGYITIRPTLSYSYISLICVSIFCDYSNRFLQTCVDDEVGEQCRVQTDALTRTYEKKYSFHVL